MKYMKFFLLLLILPTTGLYAQQQKDSIKAGEDITWSLRIHEVNVTARRPMKDIGVQQTQIDTTTLHENITLSMAGILTNNTTIFIKQYGRATLSTASFRGTSPSHTQVSWNGMRINSPMLGMVDFSMIPSFFIDEATLLHGTSSINITGGGLGGAITMGTQPMEVNGFKMQYIQGISSFKTFDEYVRLMYGTKKWQFSTRAVYSSSENRYKYTNYMKKIKEYDDERNVVKEYHPVERNKSGDFHDLHLLQEAYYNTGKGDRFGLSAWFLKSRRGVPMLNVDYKDDAEYINEQKEITLRSVLSWDRTREKYKLSLKSGYIHTNLRYDYARDLGNGERAQMIDSKSVVHTAFGSANGEYYIGNKWLFTTNLTGHQHFVKSQDMNIITQDGRNAVVGYNKARIEVSGSVSAKWQPTDRLGLSTVIREDMYGGQWTPIIPAFFTDYVVSKRGNVIAKASVSRNFRFPTLNDLYFLPGGNPDLKKERGFTYDAGMSFAITRDNLFSLNGEVTWFDSRIKDWIVWLPTFKGFWTPKNVKEVHAYGIEVKLGGRLQLPDKWSLEVYGNYAWTPSINNGNPVNWADDAIGKQLVYIPEHSSAITGKVSWKSWRFMYKWTYYDERFTTSSNDMKSKIGRIAPYFMSDISLEKQLRFRIADLSIKGLINNLFDEEYESVLSRPMPGINFGMMIDMRPKW